MGARARVLRGMHGTVDASRRVELTGNVRKAGRVPRDGNPVNDTHFKNHKPPVGCSTQYWNGRVWWDGTNANKWSNLRLARRGAAGCGGLKSAFPSTLCICWGSICDGSGLRLSPSYAVTEKYREMTYGDKRPKFTDGRRQMLPSVAEWLRL